MKKTPKTDADLLSIIAKEERGALGSGIAAGATVGNAWGASGNPMTTLELDRYAALNAYWGRPDGHESEDGSRVVLTEFADTVEWVMPQLMRAFTSAQRPCVFDPETGDDVEQADVQTEAVNHVFMTLNPGFEIIYDFAWDSLVLRNGYIKTYFEEVKEAHTEHYTGLDEWDLTQLMTQSPDDEIEVLEQAERQVAGPLMMNGAAPSPMTVFDLTIRRTATVGRVCVEAVPCEEVLVSQECSTNLDKARFVCHRTSKTRSELIEEGYDPDIVKDAVSGRPEWLNIDALARDVVADQLTAPDHGTDNGDSSMQEVELHDICMRVDYDGDGVAELRRVLVAGDKILENEEIEECFLAAGVGKRMPHRHTGRSLYDELADLQIIKSELFRDMLNNLRLSNNGRTAVDWRNCNLTDLMTSREGGVVRTNGDPRGVIFPFQHQSTVQQIIPAMGYVDALREFRTGVGKDSAGLDAEALQGVTKGGQLASMSAAALKIELIARFLSEGLKAAFVKVQHLLVRHQDKPMQFQMRGKWVEVDPTQWRERTRVSPNVGLGSGTREEARANLMLLTQGQQQLAQAGLVGPKQMYETFRMSCGLLGFTQPERFAMDPASPEYRQHMQQMQQAHQSMPNPALQVQQAKGQQALQLETVKGQNAQQLEGAKQQTAAITQNAETQRAMATLNKQLMADQQGAQHEIMTQGRQHAYDATQADMDRNTDIALKLYDILKTIVASQLKGDPSVNAGQVLADDSRAARAGL